MLTATCPKCGRATRVADVMAGRSIMCGGCGAPVQVPGAGMPPVPTGGGGAGGGVPFASRFGVAAAPAAKAGGWRPGFNLNRGSIGLLIGGCVLCFFGGREALLASGASAAPRDLTCQQLIDHGFGGNAHVRLHEMHLAPYYVHTFDKTTPNVWKAVYVPIVPTSVVQAHTSFLGRVDWPAIKASGNMHVILETTDVKSAADFDREFTVGSVDGLVVNKVESVHSVAADLLRQNYPQLNVSDCYLISEGRQLNGGLGAVGIAGGVAVILLGLWLLFKPT